MAMNNLFFDWQTPDSVRRFQLIFVSLLVVALYFIQTTIPTDNAAPVFIGLFIMGAILVILAKVEFLGWGQSIPYALKAVFYGGLMILAINLFAGFSSSFIKLAIPVKISFSLAGFFSVFYVALVAAFVEEFVFRGALLALFARLFNNFTLAVVLQAVIFGLFHLASYTPFAAAQGIPIENLLFQAGLFGLVAAIGNSIFKSAAFGLGMHLVNNILTFTR